MLFFAVAGYAVTVSGVFMYSESKRRSKLPPKLHDELQLHKIGSDTSLLGQAGDGPRTAYFRSQNSGAHIV